MSISVSARLPDELVHQFEDIAQKIERSKALHIQKAIEAYVEEYADHEIPLAGSRTKPTQPSRART